MPTLIDNTFSKQNHAGYMYVLCIKHAEVNLLLQEICKAQEKSDAL